MRYRYITTVLLGFFASTCWAQMFILHEDSKSADFGPYVLTEDSTVLDGYRLRTATGGRWRVTSVVDGIRWTLGEFPFTNNSMIKLKNRSFRVITGSAVQDILNQRDAHVAHVQQEEASQLAKGLVKRGQNWVTKAEFERLEEETKPKARIGQTRDQWERKYGRPLEQNTFTMQFEKNGFHIIAAFYSNVAVAVTYNVAETDQLGMHPPVSDIQIQTLLSLNGGTNQWKKVDAAVMEERWESRDGALQGGYVKISNTLMIVDKVGFARLQAEKDAQEKEEIKGL